MLSIGMLFGSTVSMPGVGQAANTTYYVDSMSGNDSNNGTGTGTPWQTLTKVNSVTFQPGDQILFKAGSYFTGTLTPLGSGSAVSSIVFDKYGTGATPIIDGGGSEKAVYLYNVQYITLRNLEIINDGTTLSKRSGIMLIGQGAGVMNGIHLENLDIHNIKGISTPNTTPARHDNAAIYIRMLDGTTGTPLASLNDLRIENNYIHDISTNGMYFNGTTTHANQGAAKTFTNWHTNVQIRNNIISKTGGDGIVIAYSVNPLIEHNTVYDAGFNDSVDEFLSGMWSWGAKDPVWQYNEVARTESTFQALSDSVAFDTDIANYGAHIYQYNYSHDNGGGFIMSMGQLDGENIIRYNISQNDAHNHVSNNTISLYDYSHVYNNVIYNDAGDGIRLNDSKYVVYTNNIFNSSVNHGYPVKPVFDYNNYYGHTPAAGDLHAMNVDPKFVSPGSGTDGMNTVVGYKLMSTSPLIGKGKVIAGNGGKDLWGNTVYNGAPDIGAYEYTGTVSPAETQAPTTPTGLVTTFINDTEVALHWNASTDNVTVTPGYEVYNASTGVKLAWTTGATEVRVTRLTAQTSYGFYVKARDAVGNLSSASNTLTVTTDVPGIIVDNTSATYVGTWNTSSFAPYYYGTDYRHTTGGSGSSTVTWTPNLPQSGNYYVYYWLPDGGPTRAPNAPFTIQYSGGSQTYSVNEKAKGGEWLLLGMHPFQSGTSGYVRMTNAALSGSVVIADALKFNYAGPSGSNETVIDNTQATLTGTWSASTSASDYYGSNYHYAQTGSGSTATWTPNLTAAGDYNVYYWLPDGAPNRAASAPFTVYYNGGSHTYYVNQQQPGGQWILLGKHDFAVGTSGYVRLTNTADQNYVNADAIKFVYDNPVEYIVDNTQATITGTWTASTFEPTYYGTNYIFKDSASGSANVKWTPDLDSAGDYDVYYWLPNGSGNRPTNAVFTVYYQGGSQAYTVDETALGGTWKLLGTHNFAAGTGGYVRITDSATANTKVIADAIRFVKSN